MKFLSKINRGAILTAGVILAVIAYLIVNAVTQSTQKPAIKQVCEAYLQQEVSYNMLPAQFRKDKPGMSDTALKEYLDSMKADIIAYYPKNEQSYRYLIDNLTSDLTGQTEGVNVVYAYEKTILTYDKMIFDGDTVEVSFTSDTTIEQVDPYGTGSSVKEKLTAEVADTIILQKISGEWKVIYASINRPYNETYPVTGKF
jgi:hypothetical protein